MTGNKIKPMKIKYPKRSTFLAGCEQVINENRVILLSGQTITVEFSPQGFYRNAKVNRPGIVGDSKV